MMGDDAGAERKLFKDYFDADAAKRLAAQMAAVKDVAGGVARGGKPFDQKKFVRLATKDLSHLEFAARVSQFADALRGTLPESVPDALQWLTHSLPAELDGDEEITGGWLQWPLGQFIADHGVPHFEESMRAMMELTKRLTSEFAVRPFVETYPERTFERLLALADHENLHIRRWCSEGTRPRLPWGKKLRALVEDPTPIWPILEKLKDDPEMYVRRSVANNLNDIAKDHPEQVIKRCATWLKAPGKKRAAGDAGTTGGAKGVAKAGNGGAHEAGRSGTGVGAKRGGGGTRVGERDDRAADAKGRSRTGGGDARRAGDTADGAADREWLVKHALRTLVKDGDAAALALLGYGPPKRVSATLEATPKKVKIGGAVTLSASISSEHRAVQNAMVDYVVHYVRQGNKTSGKVFKWKQVQLPARDTLSLEKRHSMKVTTIRKLYPGKHRVELQINGVRVAETAFVLE